MTQAQQTQLSWKGGGLRFALLSLGLVSSLGLASCQFLPKGTANAQPSQSAVDAVPELPIVETAIAQLEEPVGLEYTGTVEPAQVVVVRSRAEGQLLDLGVEVGDGVTAGQILGQVDDRLLRAESGNEQATLSALVAEVAEAEAELRNAEVLVGQRQIELQQATADADRFRSLWLDGVVSEQQYEIAETARQSAAQAVASAEQIVQTRQQSLQAAQDRVSAQQATLAQVEERRSDTLLSAPIAGTVLSRQVDPGTWVRPGEEILELGDFSNAQVTVEVSELDLNRVRLGQSVLVQLDAFPSDELMGRVTQISPVADSVARLIPVEITLLPTAFSLSQGLMARVTIAESLTQGLFVPASALSVSESESSPTIFVLEPGEPPIATPRSVVVGQEVDGKIEILDGLIAGETYVIGSEKPLTSSSPVRLSVLSE